MIRDANATYSDWQAITASAASTNVLRNKAGSLGIGPGGRDLSVVVQVNETFTNLTNLAIALQCDDNAAFSSATTLSTTTVLLAALVQGYTLAIALRALTIEEYTRMYYTVTGTAPDAGKVSAFIVDQIDQYNVVSFS